ncbi:Splicing factor [Steccherinum ochraceum]|uniref:U4/U6 snRNA-associated-splicing factor PRP24 n=1 Tax=Steccherinum ochraceum TaxID=92696 RepID=A0A4R0RXW3_9APHY|nr:Splicing factor [Steccherinum ochraceum]
MDEAEALDALANALTNLGDNPFDLSLHAEHIRIAQATGMQDQVEAALEMLTSYWAAGDYAWIPLVTSRAASEELEGLEQLQEIQSLFEKAERDYLSVNLLQKHLEFLVDRHTRLGEAGMKPQDPSQPFSTSWTRQAIANAVTKGEGHVTESHRLWDIRRDWELELLMEAPGDVKAQLVSEVDTMLLKRLQQPHSNHDETLSTYSTFTTTYKPPDEYEAILVHASKSKSQAVKAYERRERQERSLAQAGFSLEAYAYYISGERRSKTPDAFILGALYERAVAEADKRRFANEANAEEALRTFWLGYMDFLRVNDADVEVQLQVFERATRSIPGSGEFWARYMRFLERMELDLSSIEAVYESAMKFTPLQKDVDQLVPVILARASYEKRQADSHAEIEADERYLPAMQILFDGMRMVRKASKAGDARLRLEKFFSQVCFNLSNLPENAVDEWKDAAKHYKNSYLVWTSYTDALIRTQHYDQARSVFKDVSLKNIDWPEAIWDAWLSFEQVYGTAVQMDECLDRIERARGQVNAKRIKEEKAAYEAMQVIAEAEQQAAVSAVASSASMTQSVPMEVDTSSSSALEGGAKRKAEDDIEPEAKKPKTEQKPLPLKRDRENCTVFVADLPTATSEDDLRALFKDCGSVREIKITALHNSTVATVEFAERDSVPAALTKDKKRVHDQEIAVHLGWKSTLYVTNFPEKADDTFIRDLFGKYGVIFDVRWPSKKFKSTRRFCYVQYTAPSAANSALVLHGFQLDGHSLSVLISNPERKKERTDADANDRELYVAGLSKFVTQQELSKLFSTYGPVKDIRMILDDRGQSKGYAFVEFEQANDAVSALAANNYELKNRRIAVTLADTRNKAKNPASRQVEARNKSVRVKNLPPNTQEGLLQQALEKIAPVQRVEVFAEKREAVAELENAAEVGKLLLHTEPVVFNGHTLRFSEESLERAAASRATGQPSATGGLFVPRTAASRPRAGLGSKKSGAVVNPVTASASTSTSAAPTSSSAGPKKGQDDFRKMLGA